MFQQTSTPLLALCCHSTTGCACSSFKSPSVVLHLPSTLQTTCKHGPLCRGIAGNRVSRRSSLTDDRVDEVINNLTNMHSMVKLLRESSVDKPDASRTWDVRLLPHHTGDDCHHAACDDTTASAHCNFAHSHFQCQTWIGRGSAARSCAIS